ncbi:hypothetical protein EC845_2388 [Comamonas sp. BIGb0124]|uniref:LON peptidase substrate-binding domain-containing protein n=1 Tax=Comamonas sp. BIGb0124 TaxID=2485130 RepID=UPI000F472C51|nr:LON peptidase substrate-binding domain-containing protein [Comamonas sp. BIGb0124]ROR21566.1 hypothetical protein EC845_2388 [Comamonas sp. BIGb0124]
MTSDARGVFSNGQAERLPLFPLGTVLLPDGVLPLRVFEVRYLEMIGQCLRDGQPFGVVLLERGTEVRRPGQAERLAGVATCARIVAHERPQPGLIQLVCHGFERVRLHQAHQEKNGLWVSQATVLPQDDPGWGVLPDLEPAVHLLAQLLDRAGGSKGRAAAQPADPHPRPLFAGQPQLKQPGWVANRWIELLPLDMRRKQQLLEVDSPILRLELVADLLRQHRLIE